MCACVCARVDKMYVCVCVCRRVDYMYLTQVERSLWSGTVPITKDSDTHTDKEEYAHKYSSFAKESYTSRSLLHSKEICVCLVKKRALCVYYCVLFDVHTNLTQAAKSSLAKDTRKSLLSAKEMYLCKTLLHKSSIRVLSKKRALCVYYCV